MTRTHPSLISSHVQCVTSLFKYRTSDCLNRIYTQFRLRILHRRFLPSVQIISMIFICTKLRVIVHMNHEQNCQQVLTEGSLFTYACDRASLWPTPSNENSTTATRLKSRVDTFGSTEYGQAEIRAMDRRTEWTSVLVFGWLSCCHRGYPCLCPFARWSCWEVGHSFIRLLWVKSNKV